MSDWRARHAARSVARLSSTSIRHEIVQRVSMQMRSGDDAQAAVLAMRVGEVVHREHLYRLDGVRCFVLPPVPIEMPEQRRTFTRLRNHVAVREGRIGEAEAIERCECQGVRSARRRLPRACAARRPHCPARGAFRLRPVPTSARRQRPPLVSTPTPSPCRGRTARSSTHPRAARPRRRSSRSPSEVKPDYRRNCPKHPSFDPDSRRAGGAGLASHPVRRRAHEWLV